LEPDRPQYSGVAKSSYFPAFGGRGRRDWQSVYDFMVRGKGMVMRRRGGYTGVE
jgi:hypothetical protein